MSFVGIKILEGLICMYSVAESIFKGVKMIFFKNILYFDTSKFKCKRFLDFYESNSDEENYDFTDE